MKQHITGDQLNELSDKGNKELLKWEIKKRYAKQGIGLSPNHAGKYSLTSLSIGQMIEFLLENKPFMRIGNLTTEWDIYRGNGTDAGAELSRSGKLELCDALWEAVKSILEK